MVPKPKPRRLLERPTAAVASVSHLLRSPAEAPGSSSELVLLLLAISCGLLVALVGLAALPPSALPRQVSSVVVDHRQTLALTGIVIVASVGVALAVAGLTS